MIFNSFQFIWLFPVIFIVYWLCHKLNRPGFKVSKYVLLALSYGVYLQWSLTFGVVLLAVTAVTYLTALAISRREDLRKPLIWCGATATLAPLLLYKYLNFILHTGASALSWIGIDTAPSEYQWAVPLGLSFYTFQALGYLWDVYRKRIECERSWWDYMLFVSFFPQLLCGPISTASELLPQLKNPRPFNYTMAVKGLRMMLWGMFLKVVIADRAGLYVDQIYSNPAAFSGVSAFLASVLYSLQIYGDFAGYSYIAVGVARLLGVELVINFRRPYFAQSVSGFWKRWNISLTRWLTTYVYIPLGGNRKGTARTYGNIMTTFLVSGIWHGANLTFILWGIIHGAAQAVEKFFGLNKRDSRGVVRVLRTLLTFLVVNFAWVYFRSPGIGFANEFISGMFTRGGSLFVDSGTFAHLMLTLPIVAAVELTMEYKPKLFNAAFNKSVVVRWGAYCLIALMILIFGVLDTSQFIYVQF